jgi:hypothetical protein
VICGLGGDDQIEGLGGNDFILGGSGNDTIDSGSGVDSVDGGAGNDLLLAGPDDDAVFGGDGNDSVDGGLGGDSLGGGLGTDVANGGEGIDNCQSSEQTLSCEVFDPPLLPDSSTLNFVGSASTEGVRAVVSVALPMSASDLAVAKDNSTKERFSGIVASDVFEFGIPPWNTLSSAVITLPYRESDLDGYPAASLTPATLDEPSGLWIPIEGAVVDTVTRSVTFTVTSFSKKALVKGTQISGSWSPNFIEGQFGPVPQRCVDPSSQAFGPASIVVAVDGSGSMQSTISGTPPSPLVQDLRKDWLQSFEPRRDTDLLVYSFDSSTAELNTVSEYLAPEFLPSNKPTGSEWSRKVQNLPLPSFGGTELIPALNKGLDALASSSRTLRLAVLVTDLAGANSVLSDSSVSTRLQQIQAELLMVVFLEPGQAGPSATPPKIDLFPAFGSPSASNVQVLRNRVDTFLGPEGDPLKTDVDGDGLTDCEEQNGFTVGNSFVAVEGGSPVSLHEVGGPYRRTFTRFSGTVTDSRGSRSSTDTDGDGRGDGAEVKRVNLTLYPASKAYKSLVDRGITSVFTPLTGFPDRYDTDFDGQRDLDSRQLPGGVLNEPCNPYAFSNPLSWNSFKRPDRSFCQPDVLEKYSDWFTITSYIFDEMKNNANGLRARNMAGWRTAGLVPALLEFGLLVGPCLSWDHKPRIWDRITNPLVGGRKSTYFRVPVADTTTPFGYYDFYSNIHYGFVGARIGFDESLLIGASHLPGAGQTDPTDDMNVRFGYKLWRDYGQALTIEQFRSELGSFLTLVQAAPHVGYDSKFLADFNDIAARSRPC